PCQDGILWPTREEAQVAPRGDIDLHYCSGCSHVFNTRFDPAKLILDGSYDVSQHHSPSYQQFVAACVERLVEQYGLRSKTILEIGCGKADFLKAICLEFGNRGIGFDPTFTPDGLSESDRQLIQVFPQRFTGDYAGPPADLVAIRSVLQYTTTPRDFLQSIRPTLAEPTGVIYAEGANSAHVFERLCIWNIVYEQGCFFSRQSLVRLFSDSGYPVYDCAPCWAEDQRLRLDAGLVPTDRQVVFDAADVERFSKVIDRFVSEHRMRVNYWQNTLDRLNMQGKRVAMWGAGARAQSFCNIFDLTDSTLPFIVDINPARQGKFMPKTMQQVVSPKHLQIDKPDVILITNSGYAEEIKRQIADLGLRCEALVM
ncbi:MAG: methyltransferase domain-containing protein, partial [Tepidisphaeraceae bacterium]